MDSTELVHSLLDAYGDTLIHYASPYYDPVKAKEYYERTKELKGRQQGSATTSLSNKTLIAPQQGSATASLSRKTLVAPAANAQTARAQLAAERDAKLKAASERIKKKLDETIAKRADAFFKRLESLPEDASPELVARLMKTHSKSANKARKQASRELQSAFKSIRASFATARSSLKTQRTTGQATASLQPGQKSR